MTNDTLFDWAKARASEPSSYSAAARITGTVEDLIARVRDLEKADRIAAMRPQSPVVVPRTTSRLLINTDWARIGGRAFEPEPTDRFARPEFKAMWQAGPHVRAIYAGACEGLAVLSRVLQLPIYKVRLPPPRTSGRACSSCASTDMGPLVATVAITLSIAAGTVGFHRI